jgi:hypothetical protein
VQVGPELEVPGYGCEDHFLELDTVTHSWEAIAVKGPWRGVEDGLSARSQEECRQETCLPRMRASATLARP